MWNTWRDRNMTRLKRIQIEIPEHLVEWLEIFGKQTARSPSQVIAYILEIYYQTWRLGREFEKYKV
jgi:metal-responsive CopG/Arc/MetJ family transcriptional regulator